MSFNEAMMNARTSSRIGYLLSVNWRPESRLDTAYVWVLPCAHRSRATARLLLAELGGWLLGIPAAQLVISSDGQGQPVAHASTGRLWVSMSYGPQVLAVAACLAGPVGIDLEGPARPSTVQLAERWFDAAETRWLRGRPVTEQPHAFLLLWTAKEALGKALGTGLRGDGLQRRVPVPPVTDGTLHPVDGGLRLAHPALAADLVLALALGPGAARVDRIALQQDLAHVTPARSAARSRTSLPVVVRGNRSKT
jgi:4'-phosphopantetheinyl transferase